MKKLFNFLALILVLLTSCANDDNASNEEIEIWNMTLFSGGLMGVNQTYELGEIVWTFDSDSLHIAHNFNAGPNEIGPYPEPEIYSYHWLTENNETHLIIDGTDYGKVNFSDNLVYLDDNIAADGFYYVFIKM